MIPSYRFPLKDKAENFIFRIFVVYYNFCGKNLILSIIVKEKISVIELKVGIIGFGTVGAGVASCLLKNSDVISKRTGMKIVLHKIADLDITTDRGVSVPEGVLTTDVTDVLNSCDIIVELIGGTTKSKEFILEALKRGKSVVTANKALLADHGKELFPVAEANNADIYYEASVAGGIPVIKSLREAFVGNRIDGIYGIMNGTCNYIFTRMERENLGFEEVLADAQRLGYAEANPSLDVDGFDTAHKAAILASLAYGEWFGTEPIFIEGIRNVSLTEIRYADELGFKIKLLAIIKQENDDVQIRVHPTLVPKGSLIAGISDVFNGVMLRGDYVGNTLFYGRGAGREATASAVVADIVDAALNIKCGCVRRIASFREGKQFGKLVPMNNVRTRYYLRIEVQDKPGVLGKIATLLSSYDISISSLMQRGKENSDDDPVSIIILSHLALESKMLEAVRKIEEYPEVRGFIKLIRIEDI